MIDRRQRVCEPEDEAPQRASRKIWCFGEGPFPERRRENSSRTHYHQHADPKATHRSLRARLDYQEERHALM